MQQVTYGATTARATKVTLRRGRRRVFRGVGGLLQPSLLVRAYTPPHVDTSRPRADRTSVCRRSLNDVKRRTSGSGH